jgi:hypothetical protein
VLADRPRLRRHGRGGARSRHWHVDETYSSVSSGRICTGQSTVTAISWTPCRAQPAHDGHKLGRARGLIFSRYKLLEHRRPAPRCRAGDDPAVSGGIPAACVSGAAHPPGVRSGGQLTAPVWRPARSGPPGGDSAGPSPDGPLLCANCWGLHRGRRQQELVLPLPDRSSGPAPASSGGKCGIPGTGGDSTGARSDGPHLCGKWWGLYRARSGRPSPLQRPVGTLPGSSPRGAVGPPI